MTPVAFRESFRLALQSLNAGDLSAAAASCENLLKVAPDDPAVWQLRATILLRQDRLGQDRLGQDRLGPALGAIQQSLVRRPGHLPSMILAARIFRALGRLAEAKMSLQNAVKGAPDLAEAAFLLCHVLLELQDVDFPSAFNDLLQRFANGSAGEWQSLGLMLQRAGQPKAALAAFTTAVRVDPGLVPAHFGRGLLLREAGDMANAQAALAQAVAVEPGLAPAWFALGLTCQDLSDEAGAAAAFQSALDARPDLAEAAVNLGIARQRLGDMVGARAAYRQAMEVRPDTFGRIAQALSASSTGMLWLNPTALRNWLQPEGGALPG
jgi:tetratricopeptide (TPR) repeat protein